MGDKGRRAFLFAATVVLVFCSFATQDIYRFMWIFGVICTFVLLLVDILFFGPDKFIYDPFYANWEKRHIKDI